MSQWITRALVLTLILSLLAGCGTGSSKQQPVPTSTPAPAPLQPAPSQEQQGANSRPPEKNPTADLPPGEFLHAMLTEWGDLKNDQKYLSAPEWLALDGDNRLVVGGLGDASGVELILRRTREWFQEPRTGRALLRQTYKTATGQQDNLVLVTRSTFERWPQSQIPPLKQWTQYVDLYAARSIPSRREDFGSETTLIKHWVIAVLGNRYTELKSSSQEAREVFVTADAAGKRERDRLRETAKLGSLIFSTTSAKVLSVKYANAETATRVEVNRTSIMEWAKFNGRINDLGRFFVVDGKQPRWVESPDAPFQKQRALAEVLADRGRMEKHLPQGAKLYLGLMNGNRYNLAVIEATLTSESTFEQSWETYSEVVEKVFAEGRGLFYVDLVLHKGGETEYMRFDLNAWALRHHLIVEEEMRLEPAHLPLTAVIYSRYKRAK